MTERDELLDHLEATGEADHYPVPGPDSDRPTPDEPNDPVPPRPNEVTAPDGLTYDPGVVVEDDPQTGHEPTEEEN